MNPTALSQIPPPGTHHLMFRGDTLEITLECDPGSSQGATAFVHTNIGCAQLRQQEIINEVEHGDPLIDGDWHDMPMRCLAPGAFSLRIALNEVGHFEAKCCVVTPEHGDPVFVQGDQLHINVEPDDYVCGNSVYCAFVRQFGANKENPVTRMTHVRRRVTDQLDRAGYTVIPPSGTFRDLIKELDFIVGKLRCRIIQLLPVNPTPTTYARMGRFGSPYAALDFTAVDPALAEFDKSATPVDQFIELVDAVHHRNARLFLDIAINHTGWASVIHEQHPEWLVRNPDGSIHSPGAWGTVWEDLTELDHNQKALWRYLADVFGVWCARGVDGFRCDAGYMIPFPAWRYIIARVRASYPDTVFLLEGLGGDPSLTLNLLNHANMNWAYSELFQNYSRQAIEGYVNYANKVSHEDGLLIHYAETHDNARLAAKSPLWARMRTALCALCSCNGAFAFTNGVEWFATEKVDVHGARALNWGASVNQVDFIRRLNIILQSHPCFHPDAVSRFVDPHTDEAVLLFRSDSDNDAQLLIAVNLNCQRSTIVSYKKTNVHFADRQPDGPLVDLLTGDKLTPTPLNGTFETLTLRPGQALCLSARIEDDWMLIDTLDKNANDASVNPVERGVYQTLCAVILDVYCWQHKTNSLPPDFDLDAEATRLFENLPDYLSSLFPDDVMPELTFWRWPADQLREVMIPPHHILVVSAPAPFRAALCEPLPETRIYRQYDSIPSAMGSHFVLFTPLRVPNEHHKLTLRLFAYFGERSQRIEAPLLLLSDAVTSMAPFIDNPTIRDGRHNGLICNGKGAMIRPSLAWGELHDRYNALLAANLNESVPEDRHIMLRRLRLRVIYDARTEDIRVDLTRQVFYNSAGDIVWAFRVPVGRGVQMPLHVRLCGVPGKNSCKIIIRRPESQDTVHSVRLLIYPDLEDRNFHQETKAYAGPEGVWPDKIELADNGRTLFFSPAQDRILRLSSTAGAFTRQAQWMYNVYQDLEATRGLEATTDVWTPGYFDVKLAANEQITLAAEVFRSSQAAHGGVDFAVTDDWSPNPDTALESILLRAMRQFVVDRDQWKTVIAGYPWFLDWGRDTLICARGLIAAGFKDEVRAILLVFARYAQNGTLPNTIHGNDVSNRDTSDATLWFYVAVRDYLRITGDQALLSEAVQPDKTLKDVLLETMQFMRSGTPNGIVCDKESNLLFSPPHFTWMDTNYPAGTPRCGYPIEIESLYFAAQMFLFEITGDAAWHDGAQQTRKSVVELFRLPNKSLSDCIDVPNGSVPARQGVRTDAVRPNQIFAITLGVIEDRELCREILRQVAKLTVPGALRSLHSDAVTVPLPIDFNGQRLNDQYHPYWGHYEGNEDYRRKPAYHNGTAWTWPFPAYTEALAMTYGKSAVPTARAILSSVTRILTGGCYGHIPEILDGDYPHVQRGCDAQAWAATEYYRVLIYLHNLLKQKG